MKLFINCGLGVLLLFVSAVSFADISEYCGKVRSISVAPDLVEVYIRPNEQSRKRLDTTKYGKDSALVSERYKMAEFPQSDVINAAKVSLGSTNVEFCFPAAPGQKT